MRGTRGAIAATGALLLVTAWWGAPGVKAHCDTMDGPVVTAAKRALAQGDVKPVLVWVRPADETEVRAAFRQTLAVRRQGQQAKTLADRYFFETLVRLHRAGEGEPYTGLKPAGYQADPAILAADRALETRRIDDLVRRTVALVESGLRQRYARAVNARQHADESVAAGRRFVAAYVELLHYVEGLHSAATGKPAEQGSHGEPSAAAGGSPSAH